MSLERWIDLNCHPSKRADNVRSIQVLVRRSAASEISLNYRLDGDIARLVFSPPSETRIGHELWRHTCFEAFVAVEGQAEYHEFNFAPSREWTGYAFRGYRDGAPIGDESVRPRIAVRSTPARLELDAELRLDTLSSHHARARLRLGLSAVIESSDGLSYWALRHPADRPDFHNPDGFALTIEPCPE